MNIINILFVGLIFLTASILSIVEGDIEYLLYAVTGMLFGVLVAFSYHNITPWYFIRLLSTLIMLIIGVGSFKLYWFSSSSESLVDTPPHFLYLVIGVLAIILKLISGLRFAVVYTKLGSYLTRKISIENN